MGRLCVRRRKYLTQLEEQELVTITLRLCAEHLPLIVIPVVSFGYSRASMGSAEYGFMLYRRPRITYSRPLLAKVHAKDRVETAYHEVAHLAVFYEIAKAWNANAAPGSLTRALDAEGSHGPRWRSKMREFGYENPT